MNLLLLSNSSSDAGYLVHALDDVRALVADIPAGATALFLPYASVTRTWDAYTEVVREALSGLDLTITGAHTYDDPAAAVRQAAVIIVGGGNTFNLLRHVHATGLLEAIGERVRSGAAAYLGWSAGSNLACPTIRTTNDMPIVDPMGFDALSLVPFQINAHFTEAHPPGHRGETRRQRLAEFCRLDPAMPVLGLPEGCGLRIANDHIGLIGPHAALWLHGDRTPVSLPPGPLSLNFSTQGHHA